MGLGGAARLWPVVAMLVVLISVIACAYLLLPALMPAWFGAHEPWLRPLRRPSRSTRWAKSRDLWGLRGFRSRTGTVLLGAHHRTPVRTEPETSVLVVGPTRSGKTTSIIVPNILTWDGAAVVTSTKDELVALTAGHRQRRGPVYVYDPTGEIGGGATSVSWSPLDGCDSLDAAWRVAAWLCAGLHQGSSRSDSDWVHWGESGKLLTAPLLYVAAQTGRSIIDVKTWIHGFDIGTPLMLLDEVLAASRDDQVRRDATRGLAMLASVDQRPEKERGTVFSTMMRIFNVFVESAVEASAVSSRFDADEFLARTGTLYLCTPRLAPERVASLFVGLLMTIVTTAYRRSEKGQPAVDRPGRLGLFLDELANVVPIDELPSLASQGAGRGITLVSVVQDFSQLRARYGHDKTMSIINNHPCKLILPGLTDPETADLIGKVAGMRTTIDVQRTRGPDGRSSVAHSRRLEPIAPPDVVRQLRDGTALMLHRGRPPAMLRLRPWYRQRALRERAARPYMPSVEEVSEAA